MSKVAVTAIVVVVVILGIGGAYLANHKSSDYSSKSSGSTSSQSSNTQMHMNSSSSSNSNTSTATAANSVTIENFAFSPASITVKKGTTVTWTNKDSATHTVTENDGQTGPQSGDLATGKTYSFTYDTVGTFKYHCSIHSSMTGTVTVTE